MYVFCFPTEALGLGMVVLELNRVAQASLLLTVVLLSQPPQCWAPRHEVPGLASRCSVYPCQVPSAYFCCIPFFSPTGKKNADRIPWNRFTSHNLWLEKMSFLGLLHGWVNVSISFWRTVCSSDGAAECFRCSRYYVFDPFPEVPQRLFLMKLGASNFYFL